MAFRRKTPEERLAELKQEEAAVKAKIQRERAKLAEQRRKDDTRRKIIAGALALQHKDEGFQATLRRLLDEYVTKPDERALFDLPPLNAAEQDNGDEDNARRAAWQ